MSGIHCGRSLIRWNLGNLADSRTRMRKIDAGQALTILANVGVIVGLVLLYIELRQNNDLMRAEVQNIVAEERVNRGISGANDGQLAAILVKRGQCNVPEELEALTPEEFCRLREFYMANFRAMANQYYQYETGFLDEDFYIHVTRRSIARNLPNWISTGVDLVEARPNFVEELRRIASAERISLAGTTIAE